jgi:signal transduction histidine kinase
MRGVFRRQFLRSKPTKSYSVANVDLLLGKIFSAGLIFLYLEIVVNGVSQIEYLNVPVFILTISTLGIFVGEYFISSWFTSGAQFRLKLIAIFIIVLVLTWPIQLVDATNLPSGFQPWIWWTIGIGGVALGGAFPNKFGFMALILLPLLWFSVRLGEAGGAASVDVAAEDSLYTFLLSATITAMVTTLRWEAGKVDAANQQAIEAAVEKARLEAIDLERSRFDALVHDSVLTTLLVAANADSKEQVLNAQKSAKATLEKFVHFENATPNSELLTSASFFSALKSTCRENFPEFVTSISRISDLPIPSNVAQALTEATLQAADNSLKHAKGASERLIRIRGQKGGIKIVISDNGPGFRPSKVAKDRVGLRDSIIKRVEFVGGHVFVNSSPGKGTNLVLVWETGA